MKRCTNSFVNLTVVSPLSLTSSFLVVVFPEGKRKKQAKSTARKKSSRKRLTGANKDPWSADHRNSEDDFETDVLSSARKALSQSVRKSVRKSARKKMVYSSEEEEEDLASVVKPCVRTGRKLILSDEDD